MEPIKPVESTESRPVRRIRPMRLFMSLIALAGSVLLIIAGAQMLHISLPNLRVVGEVGETYYHALGLAIIGIGIITAVSSVRFYFIASRLSRHS